MQPAGDTAAARLPDELVERCMVAQEGEVLPAYLEVRDVDVGSLAPHVLRGSRPTHRLVQWFTAVATSDDDNAIASA